MNKKTFIGKTKEEAIELALEGLNASIDEVVIIEKEEKKGLFNKKCEIEAITKSDLNHEIKTFVLNVVKNMGIEAKIELKNRQEAPIFNLITNESSILIGKNGKTIEALQVVTTQMLNRELNDYYRFIIDVNDYRSKRKSRLERLAKTTAKDVARTKTEAKLEAMNSFDRRIIHNALTNNKYVYTESVGEDPNRCVVIKPKEE